MVLRERLARQSRFAKQPRQSEQRLAIVRILAGPLTQLTDCRTRSARAREEVYPPLHGLPLHATQIGELRVKPPPLCILGREASVVGVRRQDGARTHQSTCTRVRMR